MARQCDGSYTLLQKGHVSLSWVGRPCTAVPARKTSTDDPAAERPGARISRVRSGRASNCGMRVLRLWARAYSWERERRVPSGLRSSHCRPSSAVQHMCNFPCGGASLSAPIARRLLLLGLFRGQTRRGYSRNTGRDDQGATALGAARTCAPERAWLEVGGGLRRGCSGEVTAMR